MTVMTIYFFVIKAVFLWVVITLLSDVVDNLKRLLWKHFTRKKYFTQKYFTWMIGDLVGCLLT